MTDFVVADDEPDIAESTRILLEMAGHTAVAVTRAADILPTLRRERPRVLLQDMRMPGLDFERHLREVRSDPALRGLRIILFTANMNLTVPLRELGADGVLEKPFDPSRLMQAASQWLQAPGPA